jgi:hypothetical protein
LSSFIDISGIGVVRLTRSAKAVVDIAQIYRKDLYYQEWDKSTKEYREQRSVAHQRAADRLLELLCLNRGVYLKIGEIQNIPQSHKSSFSLLTSNLKYRSTYWCFGVSSTDRICEHNENSS